MNTQEDAEPENPPKLCNIIHNLSPIPKSSAGKTNTRKRESAAVVTSSSYKDDLLKRSIKQLKRNEALPNNHTSRNLAGNVQEKGEENYNQDWFCLICAEAYSVSRPRDIWVQCQMCNLWAHELCTEGLPPFVCPKCD